MMTTQAGVAPVVRGGTRGSQSDWMQARQPAVAYGSRARHCLRGRWFSLVPVTFPAMAQLTAAVCLLVGGLVFCHAATLRWPTLADHPHLVAVFRMDAPGSLARYLTVVLLLVMAGVAHLIYQLRGHRNDDFRGHYRLWRSVMICCLIGSVASSVPLIAMAGGMLDWFTGRRVALSGHDWVRLLVHLGGVVLAIRTFVELGWRRWASLWMAAGWSTLGFAAATHWGLLEINSPLRWTAVTAAPTVATACGFLAMTLYLRTLYLEVRGLTPAVSRWAAFRARLAEGTSRTSDDGEEKVEGRTGDSLLRRWKQRLSSLKPKRPSIKRVLPSRKSRPASDQADRDEGAEPPQAATSKSDGDQSRQPTRKPATATPRADRSSGDREAADEGKGAADPPPRRRWRLPRPSFGWLSKRRSEKDAEDDDGDPPSSEASKTSARSPKKSGNAPLSAAARRGPSDGARDGQPTVKSDSAGGEDGDDIDESDIDWSSLSKAERRRMRKQLRRSGRAA